MPIQAPQWTEFLSCPVCRHSFTRTVRPPISLGCSHTICQQCLSTLSRSHCPFDYTPFRTEPEHLPINYALLQLVPPTNNIHGGSSNQSSGSGGHSSSNNSSDVQGLSSSNQSNNSNSSTARSATTTSASTTVAGVEGNSSSGSENLESKNSSSKVTNNNVNNNNSSSSSGGDPSEVVPLSVRMLASEDHEHYATAKECIEALALYLKPSPTNNASASLLTRQMQRKVVALVCCQLIEEEGRSRAVRAARLLGERAVTELILHHQNPQQLSANLWAAVRARGCQFLGPAMQEEVLKLVLLALEDGSALSRKVLVMFVVQRLEPVYSQASKTSIGHVVQLLYRASCFKVSKREGDSSLMQLKEEFRTYEALRREHDTQIVQIATEAGLRIAPDQWSSLLYGDTTHKSHMQSINDKLQTPESFSQSVQELVLALQRTSDPAHLSNLQPYLKYLADIDPNAEQSVPTWQQVAQACSAVRKVVVGLADFVQHHGSRKLQEITNANPAPKYKVNMCWIYTQHGSCPRGNKCNFAHSEAELNQNKARHSNRQSMPPPPLVGVVGSGGGGGGGGQSPGQQMGPGGGGSKDDFYMMDQFGGKKQMGHSMSSVETSPMRFGGSGGGGPMPIGAGAMSKGSPLPPPSNNLLLPQPYNGDMMMGPMGPPQHHGPPHHHQGRHHPGHSPLHVPSGPYSGPPQTPGALHPYHNSGPGGSGVGGGKFGFDPTKFNPNIRVSPNVGQQQGPPMPPPMPPPVMPHPGRGIPRNFVGPPQPQPPHGNKNPGGSAFNQNHMFMNEMMANQMGGGGHVPPGPVGGGNKNDFLAVQQAKNNPSSPFYWRKPPNQHMAPPSSPQQQNMNKSPSHYVGGGQMGKGPVMNNPMNKGVGYPPGPPVMQSGSLGDMMSPRQPLKNSPTFFGKEELYWNMGNQKSQPPLQGSTQMSQNGSQSEAVHREAQRNHMMMGNNGNHSASHLAHLYGEPPTSPAIANLTNATRRMFDRSDSILTGEDAPFEENSRIGIFGPIQRKASNSLGSGDTMKGLAGLDFRQQAWLNSSQASSSQTSPRMPPINAIGGEKKLSPAKELVLGLPNVDPLTVAPTDSHGLVSGSSGLWSPLVDPSNGANSRWPYSAAVGSSRGSGSGSKLLGTASKLLDMEDDEKDIENGMLEISKKLATELVDDDFAT